MNGALPVDADDRLHAEGEEHVGRRDSRRADPGEHQPDRLRRLADEPQRVQERRDDDDRRAVLVIVEDGNIEHRLEPPLDLKAARSGDVLEIDPPETRCDRRDGGHDLVGVLRREADRPGVDASELLEEHRLPLHHRHRRLRADVTETEHGGAVAHDRNRVLLDRQVPDLRRILGDRQTDASDTGRICHREVVARLERRFRHHLDLAPEMQQERPVGDMLNLDPDERLHGGDDLLQMVGARGIDRDVAYLLALLDPDEIDRSETSTGLADDRGNIGKRSRPVLQVHPQRGAERGGRTRGRHRCIVADSP